MRILPQPTYNRRMKDRRKDRHKNGIERTCGTCGANFVARKVNVQNGGGLYCDRRCLGVSKRDPNAIEKKRARARNYNRTVWYPKNKKKHLVFNRASLAKRLAARRALIAKMKDRPCADCGGRFPPQAMDFDHLGEKRFNISRGLQEQKMQTVLEEIAVCEIVCSNCHRVRTHNRRVLLRTAQSRQRDLRFLATGARVAS